MKPGTRVQFTKSHIKFLKEHFAELNLTGGNIGESRYSVNAVAADALLLAKHPYKARIKEVLDGSIYRISTRFTPHLEYTAYYEREDFRKASK